MMFSKEEKDWILDNYVGKTSCCIAKLFNEKFNKNITYKQIQNFKKSRHLKSGIDTKFNKKQVPHNKKKVGEEFVSKNGYVYIKNKSDNWVLKHRYIYEQNNGLIPNGHSVIFLDNDHKNVKIENLMLVEDKVKLIMNSYNLFSSDPKLTKTGVQLAKLIIKELEFKNKQY